MIGDMSVCVLCIWMCGERYSLCLIPLLCQRWATLKTLIWHLKCYMCAKINSYKIYIFHFDAYQCSHSLPVRPTFSPSKLHLNFSAVSVRFDAFAMLTAKEAATHCFATKHIVSHFPFDTLEALSTITRCSFLYQLFLFDGFCHFASFITAWNAFWLNEHNLESREYSICWALCWLVKRSMYLPYPHFFFFFFIEEERSKREKRF